MIKRFKIVNLKAIKEIEQSFNGGIYFIKGENDLGKSTILNILDGLLSGNVNKHELLRQGTEKGFVEVETDNFLIECKFNKTNPNGRISLTDKRNGLKSTKKSIFQDVFSYNSFDAEMFVRWSESAEGRRKQIQTIKSLYPVESINRLNEIGQLIESTKELRKPVNMELQKLNSLLESITIDSEVKEHTDLTELIEKRDGILKQNADIEKSKTAKLDFISKINSLELSSKNIKDDAEREIEDLQKKILDIQENAESKIEINVKEVVRYNKRISDANDYLKDKEETKTTELDEKISNSETNNLQFAENKKAENYQKEYDKEYQKKLAFESELGKLDKEKKVILEENNPIEGLTFDEEKLYLNNIPFDSYNISDSQKLLIGFTIQVKKNPKSKIFLISRGESIGKKKMEIIMNFANEHGYQGFIEKLESGREQLSIEKYEIS